MTSLGPALDIILGYMSQHVKTKILKWDEKQVKKMHEKGDTGLIHEMVEEGQRFMEDDEQDQDKNENLMSVKKSKVNGL